MTSLAAVDPILMLFMLAAVGILARRIGLLPDPVIKGFNSILMFIAQPALMLSATQQARSGELISQFLTVLGVSYLYLAVMRFAIKPLFRRARREAQPVLMMGALYPNIGYIGVPIISAVYGSDALLALAAYIVAFNIFQWTLGVTLYTGFRLSSLKHLLNPVLLAAVVGTALFLLDIRLPGPVNGALSQLNAVNTPVAMLLVGARLSSFRLRDLLDRPMWAAAGIKLVALPVLMWALLLLTPVHGMTMGVLVVGTAMPAAASCQIQAEHFGGDTALGAKLISLTTLLCMLTIPLVTALVGI